MHLYNLLETERFTTLLIEIEFQRLKRRVWVASLCKLNACMTPTDVDWSGSCKVIVDSFR